MSNFERIYELAKAQNTEELGKLLSSGVSIDEKEISGFGSAAQKLATEGNHTAVDLLKRLGACVHTIASGYAQGGHHEQVEIYRRGYHKQVEIYRRDYRANVNQIVLGYAIGGHHAQVEIYRTTHQASVHTIASGYAIGGYHEQVEIHRKNYRANANKIARGYAIGGHHAQVEIYRRDYRADVDEITLGYAIGGHHAQVEIYRTEYRANVNEIALGYAQGGHHAQVEIYRTEYRANVNEIAYGYAIGGYHWQVEKYRKDYRADVYKIARGYALGKYFGDNKGALHILAHIVENTYRNELAQALREEASTPLTLLPRAQRIHELMTTESLNYEQALFATEPGRDRDRKCGEIMTRYSLPYEQALVWTVPQNFIIFLQCARQSTLPFQVWCHIASFLLPPLKGRALYQSALTYTKQIHKEFLVRELDEYSRFFHIFNRHKQRAASLSSAVREATPEKTGELLSAQLALFNVHSPSPSLNQPNKYEQPPRNIHSNDEFPRMISRHSSRFS